MVDLDLKPGSVSVMSTDMYIECAKEKLSRLKIEMYDLQKHIEELTKKQELKLNKTTANAKKEEDPLIGKYIENEDGTVGKVVHSHIIYPTGYIVYAVVEKSDKFYSEDYVQKNLLGEEIQTMISDKNIGEDVVDAVFGLILDEMYDMLQQYAQENDMESSTTGTHEGANYCYSVVREQMDAKDELIGRHILFDDFTIGRVVGTAQTAPCNKVYTVCDSFEPLNIQVLDGDFVKGALIDESLEKYMKDEHLGRDFAAVMFQELSDEVRGRWF